VLRKCTTPIFTIVNVFSHILRITLCSMRRSVSACTFSFQHRRSDDLYVCNNYNDGIFVIFVV
jgi:hypothetical protein